MLLKLGNWVINTELLKLTLGEQEFIVEPRAMDLLVFLTQNIGIVVSRDLLVEYVWQGTIVSDHAVTACIAKLRKILKADAQIENYIETVSKRGYRLNNDLKLSIVEPPQAIKQVASTPQKIEELTPLASYNKVESNTEQKTFFEPKRNIIILSFAIVFFLVTVVINFFFITPNVPKPDVNNLEYSGVSPVTSLKGAERSPIWSPNGKFLSFSHGDLLTKSWSLKIADNENYNVFFVINGIEKYMKPAWSTDSNDLVYAINQDGECNIMIATGFNDNKIVEKKISTCIENASDTQFVWGNEKSLIYYTEKNSDYEPRAIYQLNINTGQKSKLTNPYENGYGDYLLTYHEKSNAIYFLRNHHWQKESYILKLDLMSKKLTEIYKEDYLIQSLFVDEGENIIYNQTDFNLVRLNPFTMRKEILFQSAFPILDPFIDRNSHHLYLVAESINGTQLKATSLTDTTSINVDAFTSSRDESNPQFSPTKELIAYVSNKSGNKEVYVANYSGKVIVKTKLRSEVSPNNIIWAKNSDSIYFSDNSTVYNFNISNQKLTSFEIPMANAVVTAISNDEESFYFHSDQNIDWQIYRFKQGDVKAITLTGGFASHLNSDNSKLYFNKFRRDGLWELDLNTMVETEIIKDIKLLIPYSFSVIDDVVYYKSKSTTGYNLKEFNLKSGDTQEYAYINGAIDLGFTISANRKEIVFGEHSLSESDIVVSKNMLKVE